MLAVTTHTHSSNSQSTSNRKHGRQRGGGAEGVISRPGQRRWDEAFGSHRDQPPDAQALRSAPLHINTCVIDGVEDRRASKIGRAVPRTLLHSCWRCSTNTCANRVTTAQTTRKHNTKHTYTNQQQHTRTLCAGNRHKRLPPLQCVNLVARFHSFANLRSGHNSKLESG